MVVTDVHGITCTVPEVVDDETEFLVIGPGMHTYPHIHRDSMIVGAAGLGADNVLSCHGSSPVICGDRGKRSSCDRIVDTECAESTRLAE